MGDQTSSGRSLEVRDGPHPPGRHNFAYNQKRLTPKARAATCIQFRVELCIAKTLLVSLVNLTWSHQGTNPKKPPVSALRSPLAFASYSPDHCCLRTFCEAALEPP